MIEGITQQFAARFFANDALSINENALSRRLLHAVDNNVRIITVSVFRQGIQINGNVPR